jgi:hypothetical protein
MRECKFDIKTALNAIDDAPWSLAAAENKSLKAGQARCSHTVRQDSAHAQKTKIS